MQSKNMWLDGLSAGSVLKHVGVDSVMQTANVALHVAL